jgi:basic membrane lipoprotein Med (substrate-binding protein (PBP1-ABC) superfamily)
MAKVDEPSWQAGYAAAYTAKLAGKRTPRAPHGVDGLSYSSGAVEGKAAAEERLKAQLEECRRS